MCDSNFNVTGCMIRKAVVITSKIINNYKLGKTIIGLSEISCFVSGAGADQLLIIDL